jgi:predicted Zn-dependent protease
MYKILFFSIASILLGSCTTTKPLNVNLFSIEDDKKLGAEVANQIESDSSGYKFLDSIKYASVYKYINQVRDNILNSGQLEHRGVFKWKVKIIQDDSTLNAFCTPGGYIYVFTGILKYLESEDQFAGVLGHEMAHADRRHSTRQMTETFGVQLLLEIVAGNKAAIKQISGALIGLKFSRNHEREADEYSVKYLCPTEYNAAGGAGFFQKIQAQGGSKIPEFLSTHPDPGNRVEAFYSNKITLGCKGELQNKDAYKQMVSKLP